MGCLTKRAEVEIDLEDVEKQTLIKAYKVLGDIEDDMWKENMEDTEECFWVEKARRGLQRFLEQVRIDYSQD